MLLDPLEDSVDYAPLRALSQAEVWTLILNLGRLANLGHNWETFLLAFGLGEGMYTEKVTFRLWSI